LKGTETGGGLKQIRHLKEMKFGGASPNAGTRRRAVMKRRVLGELAVKMKRETWLTSIRSEKRGWDRVSHLRVKF